MLALAGTFPRQQGGSHRLGRGQCGDFVGHDNPKHARAARVGIALNRGQPGEGLDHRIVGPFMDVRTTLAETADRTIDQAVVLRAKILVPQSARLRAAGLHGMNEDVSGAGQAMHYFAPARMVEVDADTAFVAVVAEVGGCLAVPLGREAPHVIAAVGPFNFNHGRAEIAQ